MPKKNKKKNAATLEKTKTQSSMLEQTDLISSQVAQSSVALLLNENYEQLQKNDLESLRFLNDCLSGLACLHTIDIDTVEDEVRQLWKIMSYPDKFIIVIYELIDNYLYNYHISSLINKIKLPQNKEEAEIRIFNALCIHINTRVKHYPLSIAALLHEGRMIRMSRDRLLELQRFKNLSKRHTFLAVHNKIAHDAINSLLWRIKKPEQLLSLADLFVAYLHYPTLEEGKKFLYYANHEKQKNPVGELSRLFATIFEEMLHHAPQENIAEEEQKEIQRNEQLQTPLQFILDKHFCGVSLFELCCIPIYRINFLDLYFGEITPLKIHEQLLEYFQVLTNASRHYLLINLLLKTPGILSNEFISTGTIQQLLLDDVLTKLSDDPGLKNKLSIMIRIMEQTISQYCDNPESRKRLSSLTLTTADVDSFLHIYLLIECILKAPEGRLISRSFLEMVKSFMIDSFTHLSTLNKSLFHDHLLLNCLYTDKNNNFPLIEAIKKIFFTLPLLENNGKKASKYKKQSLRLANKAMTSKILEEENQETQEQEQDEKTSLTENVLVSDISTLSLNFAQTSWQDDEDKRPFIRVSLKKRRSKKKRAELLSSNSKDNSLSESLTARDNNSLEQKQANQALIMPDPPKITKKEGKIWSQTVTSNFWHKRNAEVVNAVADRRVNTDIKSASLSTAAETLTKASSTKHDSFTEVKALASSLELVTVIASKGQASDSSGSITARCKEVQPSQQTQRLNEWEARFSRDLQHFINRGKDLQRIFPADKHCSYTQIVAKKELTAFLNALYSLEQKFTTKFPVIIGEQGKNKSSVTINNVYTHLLQLFDSWNDYLDHFIVSLNAQQNVATEINLEPQTYLAVLSQNLAQHYFFSTINHLSHLALNEIYDKVNNLVNKYGVCYLTGSDYFRLRTRNQNFENINDLDFLFIPRDDLLTTQAYSRHEMEAFIKTTILINQDVNYYFCSIPNKPYLLLLRMKFLYFRFSIDLVVALKPLDLSQEAINRNVSVATPLINLSTRQGYLAPQVWTKSMRAQTIFLLNSELSALTQNNLMSSLLVRMLSKFPDFQLDLKLMHTFNLTFAAPNEATRLRNLNLWKTELNYLFTKQIYNPIRLISLLRMLHQLMILPKMIKLAFPHLELAENSARINFFLKDEIQNVLLSDFKSTSCATSHIAAIFILLTIVEVTSLNDDQGREFEADQIVLALNLPAELFTLVLHWKREFNYIDDYQSARPYTLLSHIALKLLRHLNQSLMAYYQSGFFASSGLQNQSQEQNDCFFRFMI